MHDPGVARELRPDRASRRAAGLHAVQRGHASGRTRARGAAFRLPPSQASLQRQVHARGRALYSDVLRVVDDHGSGAGSEIRSHREPALPRRSRGRDAADRCPRVPARCGSAAHLAAGSGPCRSSAVRPGESARHQGAVGSCREHRRDQRRERPPPPARRRSGMSLAPG